MDATLLARLHAAHPAALLAATLALGPGGALADRLGEHPAVVTQRLHAAQGYDYASKFYPHPAWLYLRAEPSHPMSDHPAVLASRLYRDQQAELAARALAAARLPGATADVRAADPPLP